ncbi:MAG TPA: DUF2127 domain-containing protein [Streptosporangiaceae bacterium]|nr:DUF2127 domain-containing protein [Streptosporangiaceae bacterium]
MDWSLYRCGRAGHITYAPDEAHIREHMRALTSSGEAWRCLRCGTYVSGQPHSSGPASEAPVIRRGKEIRSDIILRLFAIERFFRFLLFGAFAYGIWRFAHSRLTITQAFNRELPIVRSIAHQLGFNADKSGVITLIRRILHISQSKLTLIAAGVSGLAVVSLIEGIGLWLAQRWGEYFAMVATSLFLPIEIYELYDKFTVTKLALFLLNVILVVYLVLNRRLFGARGGKHAYEARLRSESVLDEAIKAAAVSPLAGSAAADPGSAPAPVAGPWQQSPDPWQESPDPWQQSPGSWQQSPASWPSPAGSPGQQSVAASEPSPDYPGTGQTVAYPAPDRAQEPGSSHSQAFPAPARTPESGPGQTQAFPGAAPGSGPPVVFPGSGPPPAAATTPFRRPTGATVVTGTGADSDPAASGQPEPPPPA